jgi:signal transduction histidine kinase/DNA-binding response OmpR family regulator
VPRPRSPLPSSAEILVVDDRASQRLVVRSVLEDLCTVVEAASGREALRCLLHREFAVILLDVHMPDIDGLETAGMIRRRPSSQHTPIIFITAGADDAQVLEAYSLGAVDFIFAPVQAQVLRSKVAVFLDLFRQREQVRRHAESMQRHALRLQQLTHAAIAIHASNSPEDLLKIIADAASSTVGALQIAVELEAPEQLDKPEQHGSGSRRSVLLRPEGSALGTLTNRALMGTTPQTVRIGRDELLGHPYSGAENNDGALPLRGWLAVPLLSREGILLGWIQLSDKPEGDFTEEDEAVVLQLARMASIAAENTLLKGVREASQLKDQFLATLSHELRTPLQSIVTWASMLREPDAEPELLARGLDVIARSASAQTRLIDDLLDVSRILRGMLVLETRPLRLRDVIHSALEEFRPLAQRKRIALESQSEADPTVPGDGVRLRQVLGNLLSNAIKFTPDGGRVALRLEEDKSQALITLCDTGIGIARELLPQLFERFRQGDSAPTRSHGGLGIGLAIVRHLVELHGGSVTAQSEGPGCGSTFSLSLPLAREDAPALLGRPLLSDSRSSELRLDGLRVLLVDDDDDTRESLVFSLTQYGAELLAAASAQQALELLDRGEPQLLLADLAMPGEDGFSLIRKIRARSPERLGRIPAGALSAYARPEERARALLAGFDLHVPKPVSPAELAAAVLELARKHCH